MKRLLLALQLALIATASPAADMKLWYDKPATDWESEALPKAWPTGSVKGLKARGNFTVDIEWKDGKVTKYRIASPEPREVKVRVNRETKTVQAEKI